jgi:hypothetical protein
MLAILGAGCSGTRPRDGPPLWFGALALRRPEQVEQRVELVEVERDAGRGWSLGCTLIDPPPWIQFGAEIGPVSGHKPWRGLQRKNINPERVAELRRGTERRYNRPWWRLRRLVSRVASLS